MSTPSSISSSIDAYSPVLAGPKVQSELVARGLHECACYVECKQSQCSPQSPLKTLYPLEAQLLHVKPVFLSN